MSVVYLNRAPGASIITNLNAYIEAAIRGEQDNVARAASGSRNDAVFRAAASLSSLGMAEGEIIRALKPAAETNESIKDDGSKAFYSTIKSGVRAGRESPRQISEPAQPTPAPEPARRAPSQHADEGVKVEDGTYDYQAEDGSRLFQTVRYVYQKPDGSLLLKSDGKPRKTFAQRRPDLANPGECIWNVEGINTAVPYRRLDVLDAVKLGHTIHIVEGEPKADRLAEWGLYATCNAGGAGKWSTEHAKFFHGAADVVLHADNDEPGHRHINIVGESLQGIAARIRVLELPDLPEKGDIIDWAKAGGTKDQFLALTEQAEDWRRDERIPPANEMIRGRGLVVCRASDIKPEKIEFVWSGRLARGKHTAIAGEPGTGKSQLSLYAAAVVTTGGRWPCDEGRAPLGSVVILSAEDGIADTIVPRLIAAGADLTRVHVVQATYHEDAKGNRTFSLQADLDLLEQKIRKIGDVALVIVDPVSSYLGKVDSYKNVEVRQALQPIGELAERTGVAIMTVTHFTKGTPGASAKAIHRFIGSIAFVAAPRAAFAVVEDPDDRDRRLFLHGKNNLARPPQGLAFRLEQRLIEDDILASSVLWDPEPVATTADEALGTTGAGEDRTAKDDAIEFLRDVLAKGAVKVGDLEQMARKAGLLGAGKEIGASKPFRSARHDLEIKSDRDGFGPGSECYWSLPQAPYMPSAPIDALQKGRASMEKQGIYGDGGTPQTGENADMPDPSDPRVH